VTLSDSQIEVRIRREALSVEALATAQRDKNELVALRLPFHMRRRQGTLILEPAGEASAPAAKIDRALVRSLVLARQWARQLELGEVSSVSALAARQNLCKHYTARMLPLAYLAPDLAQQILNGTQPRGLTLSRLTSEPVPLSWSEQRTFFKRLAAA
jgi:site-specific DNA recombinase